MRFLLTILLSLFVLSGTSMAAHHPESNHAGAIKETKSSKRVKNITQRIEKKLAKKSNRGGNYRMPTLVVILIILLILLLLGSTLVSLLIFALVLLLVYYLLVQGGFI